LRAVIAHCRELGISSNNPHNCYWEGGAHEAGMAAQLALKRAADPKGLLNPGKLKAAATLPAVAQAMPEFLYP
jgi:hypothetical protein